MEGSPLHKAAEDGRTLVIQQILSKSTELLNVKDKSHGHTPLHLACRAGRPAAALLLCQHGANQTLKANNGNMPLHTAAAAGNVMCMSVLENFPGFAVDARAKFGYTPLHLAVRKNRYDALAWLAVRGAEMNIGDRDGTSPLQMAADKDHFESLHWLLAHGALPNICDRWEDTPLHDAASNGHEACVAVLVKYGANPLLANCNGDTPGALADANNLPAIARMLGQVNADRAVPPFTSMPKAIRIPVKLTPPSQCDENTVFELEEIEETRGVAVYHDDEEADVSAAKAQRHSQTAAAQPDQLVPAVAPVPSAEAARQAAAVAQAAAMLEQAEGDNDDYDNPHEYLELEVSPDLVAAPQQACVVEMTRPPSVHAAIAVTPTAKKPTPAPPQRDQTTTLGGTSSTPSSPPPSKPQKPDLSLSPTADRAPAPLPTAVSAQRPVSRRPSAPPIAPEDDEESLEVPTEVLDWLSSIRLAQYANNFVRAGFDDLSVMSDITEEDCSAIGVTLLGHRKRLMKAVEKLKAAEQGGATESPATSRPTSAIQSPVASPPMPVRTPSAVLPAPAPAHVASAGQFAPPPPKRVTVPAPAPAAPASPVRVPSTTLVNAPKSTAQESFARSAAKNDEDKEAKIQDAIERMKQAMVVTMPVEVAFGETGRGEAVTVNSMTTVKKLLSVYAKNRDLDPTREYGLFEWWREPSIERLLSSKELILDVTRTWPRNQMGNRFVVRHREADTQVRALEEMSSNEFPTMQGTLQTRQGKNKSWKERYFVLTQDGLHVFKERPVNSRAYEKPDAFMAYEGSVAYKVWGEVKKAPAQFTFIIKSAPEVPSTTLWSPIMKDVNDEFENRCRWCAVDDEGTMEAWIKAIKQASLFSERKRKSSVMKA